MSWVTANRERGPYHGRDDGADQVERVVDRRHLVPDEVDHGDRGDTESTAGSSSWW